MFKLHTTPKAVPLLFLFTPEDEDSQAHQKLTQAPIEHVLECVASQMVPEPRLLSITFFKLVRAITSNYEMVSHFFFHFFL